MRWRLSFRVQTTALEAKRQNLDVFCIDNQTTI